MKNLRSNPLFYIFITAPIVLWFICLLLPTFDDWSYITTPGNGVCIKRNILPFWSYWRPFDAIIGWILSLYHPLFPILNHIIVYGAHLISTFIIYKLCIILQYNQRAIAISTFFFYFSPAVLGTVLGIDSINQATAQLWGLVGLYLYLINNKHKRQQYILWISSVFMATLSKENGICFFVVIPFIAYGFDFIDKKKLIRHWSIGIAAAIVYFTVRLLLNNNQVDINHEYFENTLLSKAKHVAMFVAYPFINFDYVSLFYPPKRNIFIVIITLILALPFIVFLFFKQRKQLTSKPFIILSLSMFLLALPHLLTLFTTMHAYAGHSMAALIIGLLVNQCNKKSLLQWLFLLFVVSNIYTDYHHWIMSYRSGLTGKSMAQQAIEKTGVPVDKVYTITIDKGEQKYSSFCVIPVYAFGWGIAAANETNYEWPKEMEDSTIYKDEINNIPSIINHAFKKGYNCIWIVDNNHIEVVKK